MDPPDVRKIPERVRASLRQLDEDHELTNGRDKEKAWTINGATLVPISVAAAVVMTIAGGIYGFLDLKYSLEYKQKEQSMKLSVIETRVEVVEKVLLQKP